MLDTQLASWDGVQGSLPERRRAVLGIIASEPNGLPLFRVVQKIGWPVNCVSGRITELAKEGLIEDAGVRAVNPATGKSAVVWRVKRAAV